MFPEAYPLFVLTSVLLCLSPGPDMMVLLARTLAQGRSAGLWAALGVNLGNYLHLLATLTGVSALIAASPTAFQVLKSVGAAYLLYLGIVSLCTGSGLLGAQPLAPASGWQCFWQGFWSDVLNPKVAVFYLAFLPQFTQPGTEQLGQLLLLGISLNLIGLGVALGVVWLAGPLANTLARTPQAARWMNPLLGLLFIGLGGHLLVSAW